MEILFLSKNDNFTTLFEVKNWPITLIAILLKFIPHYVLCYERTWCGLILRKSGIMDIVPYSTLKYVVIGWFLEETSMLT